MADVLGWLLYASAQAGWHQGGHGTTAAAMVEKFIWRLISLVLCVSFTRESLSSFQEIG